MIDMVMEDLKSLFNDFREEKEIVRTIEKVRFSSKDLFYYLIDETERTFRAGMIVSATVVRVFNQNGNQPSRILCRLENGLDANILENDADFFGGRGDAMSVDTGSIITGRIDEIKFP